MLYMVAAVGIPLLWVLAFLVQRRVVVSRTWLQADAIVGVVIGVVVAIREGPVQGVLIGLAVLPVLVLFSALRTVHMRYVERKTQAILDGTPGMREAYDRQRVPSRRERRASRDGGE